MKTLKRIISVAAYNFRGWHRNPRIIITFALAFVLCFLLSDKAVRFAVEYHHGYRRNEVYADDEDGVMDKYRRDSF